MRDILKKQYKLQSEIAKNFKSISYDCDYLTNHEVIVHIKESLFCMNEEVNELILAIGDNDRSILKPWSIHYNDIVKKEFKSTYKIREEAIDMLCFCLNICIIIGLTPDNIESEFDKKWLKNMKRQKYGY